MRLRSERAGGGGRGGLEGGMRSRRLVSSIRTRKIPRSLRCEKMVHVNTRREMTASFRPAAVAAYIREPAV